MSLLEEARDLLGILGNVEVLERHFIRQQCQKARDLVDRINQAAAKPEEIAAARSIHGDDDVEIPDNATVSCRDVDGRWVEAYVWVHDLDLNTNSDDRDWSDEEQEE